MHRYCRLTSSDRVGTLHCGLSDGRCRMEANSKEIAKHLIENRAKLGGSVIEEIVTAVHNGGGKLVQFDPDGDWCGTGRFPHWPPKGLDSLISIVAKAHGTIKIFPYGIPVIDGFDVEVARIGPTASRF